MATKPRTIRRPRQTNANGVLLEEVRAQNKAVLEAVHSLGERMDRDIFALRTELVERIERLETAVRQNSRDIRRLEAETRRLETELSGVKAELNGVKAELSAVKVELSAFKEVLSEKAERASLEAIERRIAALERRVGG
jgi:chromosome segregation ATPase